MPLDNTAKLADIITALQTMEGINAKAELASVVGSPANADDTMATINSVIQGAKNTLVAKMDDGSSGMESLQGLIEKLVMGKKWASGTAMVKAAYSFTTFSGAGTNSYRHIEIQKNGFDFVPSIIFAKTIVSGTTTFAIWVYDDFVTSTGYGNAFTGTVASLGNVVRAGYILFPEVIKIPFNITDGTTVNWIAFE